MQLQTSEPVTRGSITQIANLAMLHQYNLVHTHKYDHMWSIGGLLGYTCQRLWSMYVE